MKRHHRQEAKVFGSFSKRTAFFLLFF